METSPRNQLPLLGPKSRFWRGLAVFAAAAAIVSFPFSFYVAIRMAIALSSD